MSRKDRRRAAAAHRKTGRMSEADRRQLITRIAIMFVAIVAAMIFFAVVLSRGI